MAHPLLYKTRQVMFRCTRRLFGWPPVAPPYEAKQNFIAQIGRESGVKVMVETGTFEGDMLACQLSNFQELYSVELSDKLYQEACKRFAAHPHIRLVHGDSSLKLSEIAKAIDQPALFWLDAHYSFGITAGFGHRAPIFKELSCLAGRKQRDVILIDDARLFGWDFGYPSKRAVKQFVSQHWPNHKFRVENDIICITPA